MIAIVLCSRGLIFAEVEHEIEKMRLEHDIVVFRTWNKPIPDAQNYLTEEVLKNPDIDYLFFIEEDTVPPEGALEKLLTLNTDIACIDYGVNGYSCVAKDKKTEEIYWCGLGCTLIKRKVFDKIEKPWFRTDKTLRLNDWKWIDNPAKYGGHDIWFCMKAREKGFTIQQVEGECRHLKLVSVGVSEYNNGLHIVKEKPKIVIQQYIETEVN